MKLKRKSRDLESYILAIAFLAFLFITSACGSRVTPVKSANEKQVLLFANDTEPNGLDPHIVTGVTEHNILIGLFEGLVTPHPETLEPLPGVARSWNVSDEGTVYTFQLKEEAKWSNGDPLLAKDFAFSFQRILSPKLAGEYAYMLYPLKNAEAFHNGELKDFSKVGVRVLGDHELELTLKSPIPYFLSLIMHFTWSPVHPASILKHGEMDQRDSRWTRSDEFVSNGPFVLEEWNIWDRIVLKKNERYWNSEIVRLQEIHFLPIESINTAERAFRAEQIHVTSGMPTHKIQGYQKEKSPYLRIDPYLGTYYYLLNCTIEPLTDTRVRKALSLSIDRQSIIDTITRGGQEPAFSFTPPKTAEFTANVKPFENIEEAKRLLAEAGFKEGVGFPKLELLYNSSDAHKAIAEAIQQMWKKNLGIEVSLVNQDWKVYLALRREKDYQIARASWIGDYNDPNTFLDLLMSSSGINHTGWGNEEYDGWIRSAGETLDQDKRFNYFQKAEGRLVEEAPIIPIYFYKKVYLLQTSVRGWHPNILDWHPYQHVYLEE